MEPLSEPARQPVTSETMIAQLEAARKREQAFQQLAPARASSRVRLAPRLLSTEAAEPS